MTPPRNETLPHEGPWRVRVEPTKWITLAALGLLLAEGFVLSVFPNQFREMLLQSEPRWLQAAGLVETILAATLIAGIVLA